jgi:hypothetical protein
VSVLIGTGGAAQYKSPKRFKTPKGRYWVGGGTPQVVPIGSTNLFQTSRPANPKGGKCVPEGEHFYGFKWVCRAERNDLPLLLGNRSTRRSGGARAQRGNERRPSNTDVQEGVLGF